MACVVMASCSVQKEIGRSAEKNLFSDPTLANAHIGISIYDTESGKYLYSHQQNKFFVPASNTKIFTCYAAMKYLGDSLPGIKYMEAADSVYLFPTGDPTLLHKDFERQPVIRFLQQQTKPLSISSSTWRDNALGYGWTWSDYNSSYMAERSPLPVYGNLIRFVQTQQVNQTENKDEPIIYTEPDINWKLNFNPDPTTRTFSVRRNMAENVFRVTTGNEKQQKEQAVPFVTHGLQSAIELLKDTVYKDIAISNFQLPGPDLEFRTIYSQKTDSMLTPMMHVSDNFHAEQSLLMVSNTVLGYMDADRIIDTLLKGDLKELPQKPRWVDGSGLSRYNLFTPQDFVWVLNRMRTEFSFERIKLIFPTGNEGTLNNYYVSARDFIYAKTGTLSGQLALSGYLITRKNKLLIFSVLVNNHNGSAPAIRRQVEAFLLGIRDKY
ncbi:MAG TPA: D-alanyl-D-alanine carboxypeptidase [Chitinophagaceae bacterium]|nr:D-alanyl-D-alanine carboxypeptidase [Chitinophagaceae bacterium]